MTLTNHIEAGFQRQLKTGVVFIDLTAAYDTVWKKGLLYKFIKAVPCLRIVNIISNMLSDRLFKILLNDQCTRFKKLNNGLAQGSVLSCLLFNLYIHDLPPSIARKFLYADDMAYAAQPRLFSVINARLSKDMGEFVRYCKKWRLVPSIAKTVESCFHLNNKLARTTLRISFAGTILRHDFNPTYLGMKLDRSLTYGANTAKLCPKLASRNNLLRKLTGTTWGASAACLRTTALSLVYSCAEYCCSTWLNSAHAYKVDIELNKSMRLITGTVDSTRLEWLPALSNIAPPDMRRKRQLLAMYQKILESDEMPLHRDLSLPRITRLKSRNPPIVTAETLHSTGFNPKEKWKESWSNTGIATDLFNFETHSSRSKEFNLPRKLWCNLNRLRTGHGRCNDMLYKWKMINDPGCACGCQRQTTTHMLNECPLTKYDGDVKEITLLSNQTLSWLAKLNL